MGKGILSMSMREGNDLEVMNTEIMKSVLDTRVVLIKFLKFVYPPLLHSKLISIFKTWYTISLHTQIHTYIHTDSSN
jgi:hypothetical protein